MHRDHEDRFSTLQRTSFSPSKARNLLTSERVAALAGAGIKSSQIGALLLIFRSAANSPLARSRLLGIDSGSITPMLDRMERKRPARRDLNNLERRVIKPTLTEARRTAAGSITDSAVFQASCWVNEFF